MPRLQATAGSQFPHKQRPLFCAALLISCGPVLSQGTAQTAESAPPQLKLERQLDESRSRTRDGEPTFARAQSIEGSVGERLILRGDAEIRRGGAVMRGDTITYTQATDIVNVEGQARLFRDGAVFTGPRLDFRVDAQTGSMPDATFAYAPRQGRGEASLIEFLGSERARMENARFTTCGPGDNAWWVQAESIEFDGLDETATATFGDTVLQGCSDSRISHFELSDQRPAQIGFSHAEPRFELEPRHRHQGAVLLQPCAELRLHVDAAPDDQTRRAF